MPDLHGFEVCRRLKQDALTSAIPVIFLTGEGQTAQKVLGFDMGAVDYITKPFEPAELRARVRAALRTKLYQDLLAERAHVDALTGLGNRAAFDTQLKREIGAFARYGRQVSLILIDLDHFKQVNDQFGHPVGDRALQVVAGALVGMVRSADAVCRYGGEELALILTDTGVGGARALAERVRRRIERLELRHEGTLVPLSASLGVASIEDLGEPTETSLVEAADAALYEAKRGGRNRVGVAGGPAKSSSSVGTGS